MDEKKDKHFCIVCNETIYGLINYVIHRKNSCPGKNISDLSNSVNNADEDLRQNKSPKTAHASEPVAQDNHKDVSQFKEQETSLPEEIKRDASLHQDSDTSSAHSDEDLVIDEATKPPGINDETSLQSCTYHEFNSQNSLASDLQVQSVDESVDEHGLMVESSGKDWDSVPNDIKEVLLGTQEKLFEVSDTDSVTRGSFDTVETHNEVDTPSHSPDKSGYGLLSITVAGDTSQDSNKKKTSPHSKPDGTPFKTKKTVARGRRKSAKHSTTPWPTVCEICSVQVHDYAEYVEHKVRQHMGDTTESCEAFEGENSYVEVKVEDGIEMQDDQDSKEEHNDQEMKPFKVDNNNIDNDIECEDLDGVEMDDHKCELDEKFDSVEMENSDSDERSNKIGEIESLEAHHCKICNKMFATKHNLVRHLINPSHKKKAAGKEKEYFRLIKKYHKSIVHKSPFRCDICSFYFNDHEFLKDHLISKIHRKKVGKAENIVCSLCNFTAVSHQLLISHVLSPSHVNKVKRQDRVCTIKIGRRTKGPRKALICNICPVEFTRMTPNKSHFLTKEHITWKLAFERGRISPGLENNAALYGTSQENESGDGENEIKIENFTSVSQSAFDGANFHQNGLESVVFNDTESETVSEMNREALTGDNTKTLASSDSVSHNELTVMQSVSQSYMIGQVAHKENSDQSYSLKRASACKYCSFETQDYNEMRPHYMRVHAEMVKICEVCDFVFPHGKGYKLHVNSKDHQAKIKKCENNSEGLFECHVCKKKFAEEGYCKFHTAYYHFHLNTEEDVFRENGNGVTRVKYADFIAETEKMSNRHVLTCPECNAQIMKLNMLGHLRTHTGEKPFMCNICTDEFFNSSSLRRHLLKHFDCLENICEICGEKFKGLTSYNVHMDIHKAKNTGSEKSNICHICGEAFYVKRQLRNHMKKHATKDFKCDAPGCLWAFSNMHALKRHMLTHSDENPFICPTCGYSTKSHKYLQSHEKIHSKDKLLQCEHCSYQTIKTTHLRRHMRIHLGTKPFKCPYCSYACNTHDNIRKHILETTLHKGLKVYPCKLCDYATNCTKEFRTHILTEHSEITAEELRGGSLAVFTGLFNKAEDIQTVSEGMEILPCKDRKTSRRKIQSETQSAIKHE